jgi:hypothetical protein
VPLVDVNRSLVVVFAVVDGSLSPTSPDIANPGLDEAEKVKEMTRALHRTARRSNSRAS